MASNFESMWDRASARMDAAVDTLGDNIEYALDGVTFVNVKGFIFDNVDGETSYESFDDDFDLRKRVKIPRAFLAQPLRSHRLRHPRLGTGSFQPGNSEPKSEGRYWLFEVQKV